MPLALAFWVFQVNKPGRCGWRGYCWQGTQGLLVLEDPSPLLRTAFPQRNQLRIYLCYVASLKHCWTSCGVVKERAEGIQTHVFLPDIFCGCMQYLPCSACTVPFALYLTEWFHILLCLLFVGISCLSMDLGLQLSSVQPVRTIP